MPTLNFYLARDNSGTKEFLYLPAEQFNTNLDIRLIAPQLPGNTSTGLTGANSTNFILNLGSQRANLDISGLFLNVASGEFPTLSMGQQHIFSGATTVSSDQSGKDVRDTLLDWAADQSDGDFADFVIGYPNWSSSEDPREWEGMVVRLDTTEISGEEDQYMYRMSFQVGST